MPTCHVLVMVKYGPIERWEDFAWRLLFIHLGIRRRQHVFSIREEVEFRLLLDEESSESDPEG